MLARLPWFQLAKLFLLLAFVPTTLLAASTIVSLLSKAAPTDTILSKNLHQTTFNSQYGYSLRFDKALWLQSSPARNTPELENIHWRLQSDSGHAVVTITVLPGGGGTQQDLSSFATLKRQQLAAPGASIIGESATAVNNFPAYQFVLGEQHFGVTESFQVRYVPTKDYLFEVHHQN